MNKSKALRYLVFSEREDQFLRWTKFAGVDLQTCKLAREEESVTVDWLLQFEWFKTLVLEDLVLVLLPGWEKYCATLTREQQAEVKVLFKFYCRIKGLFGIPVVCFEI